MSEPKVTKVCGHADCSVSTGFCEDLTFGRGALDDYGYWAIPCGPCARAWEAAHPKDGECWPQPREPFADETDDHSDCECSGADPFGLLDEDEAP